VRIHLGHHFYGAGNVGDDFMLAGFLGTARKLAPSASFTGSVPFDTHTLQSRFPEVEWLPYTAESRNSCISKCDVWLGLGGSPFQSAQSRWFIDHLIEDARSCEKWRKPMFYLGVGIQVDTELLVPEIASLANRATKIWTRDAKSGATLKASGAENVTASSDLAHLFFCECRPPPAKPNRAVIVANFDYTGWPACSSTLRVIDKLPIFDRVWLAQESRPLPGAERDLYATLSPSEQARWRFVPADNSQKPMIRSTADIIASWPSGEWLITSRYHAALAGAWSGSKVVVIGINEKLRGIAHEFGLPCLSPTAVTHDIEAALTITVSAQAPTNSAKLAFESCREFFQLAT
jgi:polysaccharide pyruvyl transferase WcaK-like protein